MFNDYLDIIDEATRCRFGGQLEEQEIIWLDDPLNYKYLRESYLRTGTRQRPINVDWRKGYKLVAYAKLLPDAPGIVNGTFYRRVWHVKPSDPYPKDCPIEGVIPLSIQPGFESMSAFGYV